MRAVTAIFCAVVTLASAQGYDTTAPSPPHNGYGEAATPAPVPQSGYDAPAPTSPPASGYDVPPTSAPADEYSQPRNPAEGAKTIQFPLKSCYLNDDGFMCCNKELEKLMSDTYDQLSKSRNGKWKKCNIHQVTVAVQRAAEQRFDVQFEAVTGAGDFASKNNFSGDLVCKIKREASYILAYATPNF
ncbi:unnamed protein product [Bursaphelenchus xylophilus]|uniref:(pine wood nematode) hypothetical protein n=1 Tax=Bursaphelenchus xylophilus TaxID=6326 RepID=A0A1I7SU81_BURXY|nr:unnamed protein product [Bursaphelenchus xylophilus]CAG9107461.1 unnamed protein product [Bursaphelenchus xylophilus]